MIESRVASCPEFIRESELTFLPTLLTYRPRAILTITPAAMTGEPRGFSRVTAGFSSYDGEFRLPLVLAQAHIETAAMVVRRVLSIS